MDRKNREKNRQARFRGSLLGLALGDAMGAPHEGGPLERGLWFVIGRARGGRRRWTDDTQMTLDVADSLIAEGGVNQDDLAARFARSYRWSRGYGGGASRVLKRIRRGEDWRAARSAVFAEGSWGNGGGMRAGVIGLFHADEDDATIAARAGAVAEITHAHRLGIEGAQLVALASARALRGEDALLGPFEGLTWDEAHASRLEIAREWRATGSASSSKAVASALGRGIAAVESCVTAIYLASVYLFEPFEALLAAARELGGDVDTIGAMAGGIWGARRGASALPAALLEQLEDREGIEARADALADLTGGGDGTRLAEVSAS